MKECEIYSNLKVPCGSSIVCRLDGRKFSRLSRDLNFKKPLDKQLARIMVSTSMDFFKEFNPYFIYTFSDEINILLSDIPFAGRIEKLNSVFASFIAGSFTKNAHDLNKEISRPISFDSRLIPLSETMVHQYFKERQDEAWRNCMNGYAYWILRKDHSKEEAMSMLKNQKSDGLHEILFKKGINLAELPAWERRGIGIYKKKVMKEGYNPVQNKKVYSKRNKIYIDCELPLFNQDFFQNLIK